MRLFKVLVCSLLFSAFFAFFASCGVEGSSFVSSKNGKLVLADKPYYLSGANQYYFFYKDHKMIDDVLEKARSINLSVIRTWAFCEGAMHDGFCFQPNPRQYDEATFRNLDYTVSKAKKENVKLILTLSNNWDAFGGVDQYLRWVGKSDHDSFFRDRDIKNIYKDYVAYLLNRINVYTGVAYKDEPTILMWDLMNEPRSNDKNALYAWLDEMGGYVKSIDKNHLVCSGSEGSIASDFIETHKSKNIDVASFHLYPDWWNMSDQQSEDYIKYHASAAKNTLHKPVFLGEFGIKNRDRRNEIFSNWYRIANDYKIDGMLFWLLSGKQSDGSLYPDYDGFTVWCPESGSICETIKNLNSH